MSLVEYHDMLEGKEVDYVESLGAFKGYNPSLDPYREDNYNNHVDHCI